MPQECQLCNSQHRKQIDRYLSTGATYPQFKDHFKKYSFSRLSPWQLSRHRRHIEDTTITNANDALGEEVSLTIKTLNHINRKLMSFAQRSERSGKSAQHSIAAYSTLLRSVELLERLRKPEDEKKPEPQTWQEFDAQVDAFFKQPQFARWLKPEELDAQLTALIGTPNIGEWFRDTLEKTYPDAVAKHTESIIEQLLRESEYRERLRRRIVALDGEQIIEQMVTDVDLRERVRAALLEQDIGLADDEQAAPVEHDTSAVPAAERSTRELLADSERRREAIEMLISEYWTEWCTATAEKNSLEKDYGRPYDVFWWPPREIRRPA